MKCSANMVGWHLTAIWALVEHGDVKFLASKSTHTLEQDDDTPLCTVYDGQVMFSMQG